MIATLCSVSSRALWLLTDNAAASVVHSIEWEDSESSDMASQIAPKLKQLLESENIKASNLTSLGVVTGPGAFTGLRVTCSFIEGLARSLLIPVISIPTFDLAGEHFQIPLQHQKFREIYFSDAQTMSQESLQIKSATSVEIAAIQPNVKFRGYREHPLWPDTVELFLALQKNISRTRFEPITIEYGLNPKISGKRIESLK